ncbi:secreted RxLR effector protein 161-like [Nicotiana tabacum]|uniref:Secreted RxLR effector protein 161-like n=1 Tax=Nicotiana tabacum TaxID=4097 RepID=A0AC58T5K9_TOBAC
MTRLDIAFAVQVLIQYMHCPKVSHMEAALRVVRYIKQAPIQGLLMPAERADKLIAYCDSDWASCIESRRPATGYLVKFGNALVSWKSKKQITVSKSSAEVDKAAIQIAANLIFHERTKHINIDCHFVREKICEGLLKTHYVHTKDQLADLLTKSLGKFQHDQLLNQLGVKNRSVSLKCGFPLRVFFQKPDLQIYDS